MALAHHQLRGLWLWSRRLTIAVEARQIGERGTAAKTSRPVSAHDARRRRDGLARAEINVRRGRERGGVEIGAHQGDLVGAR
jgi:hypothetical protein